MGKARFQVHRPSCWEDLVGHARHKRAIESMKCRGSLGGRAFWISGPSGIGKTSMAYLIAGDVCDRDNFIEADAGELCESLSPQLFGLAGWQAVTNGGFVGR